MKPYAWMMVLLFLIVPACGYQLEGGGYLNENVTRVAVEVFENKSNQTRAGIYFTNEMIREIQEKTNTAVVDKDKAGRRITGTVKSIAFSTLSRSSTETVTERKVTARVDVQLKGPDNEILWSVSDYASSEAYTVADNTTDDEANIREAVETIAERSAERIVSMMMSNF